MVSMQRYWKSVTSLTTFKIDGSSSVVLGYRGVRSQRLSFVSDKHRFSRGITCTTKDLIKSRFGHLPNLERSLCELLEVVPEIVPCGKIYQGDLLFTPSEPPVIEGKFSVCMPNVHRYTCTTTKPIGIALHTDATSIPFKCIEPDVLFLNSKNVYIPSIQYHHPKSHNTMIVSKTKLQLNAIKDHEKYYKLSGPLKNSLKKYITNCTRQGVNISLDGFKSWVETDYDDHIASLKMAYAIENSNVEKHSILSEIRKNSNYIVQHMSLYMDLRYYTDSLVPKNHSDHTFYGPVEGLIINKFINGVMQPYVKLVPSGAQNCLLNRTVRC